MFVSSLLVPVSAVSVNGNEFIFKDYVKYDVAGDSVNVSAVLPNAWYVTNAFTGPDWYYAGTYFGKHIKITPPAGDYLDLQILPLAGSAYTSHDVGYQFQDTRFIDIRYIPSDTVLTWGFELNLYGNDIVEYIKPRFNMILFFVDVNGVVTYKHTSGYFPTMTVEKVGNQEKLYCDYSYTFEFAQYEYLLPPETVGFVPYCCVDDLYMDVTEIELIYSDFGFNYSMSSLQYEALSNQLLQDTMDSVENALGDMVNGTPEQNQQAEQAVGGLNQAGDKLESLGDSMASVEKPNVDGIKADLGSFVNPNDFVVLTAPFHKLWENDTLLSILTVVVTLVIVSWVFFGKKR